ncbi:MAG TPA: PKD domain-containing protein [Vicinamibacterales bacterium]
MRRLTSFVVVLFVAVVCMTCDSVPLTAPTNSTILLTAGTNVLPVGGSTTLTAEVIEPGGTTVHNGTTVRFFTSLGRVDPVEAQTRNGIATATFFAGDASGLADVRATSGGAGGGSSTPSTGTGGTGTTTPASSGGSSLTITIGAAAIKTVTVRVNPSTVSQNGGSVQVVATVASETGRLLSNIPVSFSATHGTFSSGSAVTDAAGEASVMLNTNADTDVTATAGAVTSAVSKVTVLPAPSILLTCAVGTAGSCAAISTGETVTFTATKATGSSTISSSTLDFGDGQSVSLGSLSSPQSVAHQYSTAGTYTARLSATDVNGDNTTTTAVIRVEDLVAILSLTITNTQTRTVQATATLSAIGVNIARYEWTFGPDASQSSLITTSGSASVSFTTPGTKVVTVRIVLTDGRSATASAQIDVP